MNIHDLSLSPEQIENLVNSLHAFHADYGALDSLLDLRAEQSLLDGFREVLESFFMGTDKAVPAVESLGRIYHSTNMPFALLMGGFNHIKNELAKAVVGNMQEPILHYKAIDCRFEFLKNKAAYAFMHCEVRKKAKLPSKILQEKILIRLYVEWLDCVNQAISSDNLDEFPLEAADESKFHTALRYPESMLICLDLKLCDQILEQHRLIIQQSSMLYAMLRAGRFEQACIAYQDMTRKVVELLNLLSVLYFESQTNRINRFFNFLQAALYLPGRKFLSIINIRDLGRLNKLYGTCVGDGALDCVENILRAETEVNREWLVYTRGISGDFYLVGHNTSVETMRAVLERLRQAVIDRCSEAVPCDIDILFYGIELTELNELTTEVMHFLVQYLTEQARKANGQVLVGEDSARTMMVWIRDQYHKSLDLQAKLTADQTDIFIQPLVTLDSKREIHAFEVLGRFRDGEGYISAGLFMDDIIEMGLAADFDRLVLESVARHITELSQITRRLFINVSADSLEREDYLSTLIQMLDGPLKEFEVVLELTEQILLERRVRVGELHRQFGLVFAIDDFGTGYSTLQTVIELALEGGVRYLKLDGSLTRDICSSMANQHIMQITRQMAKALNLETVVEFVEKLEQAEKLDEMQMDYGQGYLLGVPDPVSIWLGKVNYLRSRQNDKGGGYFTL